MEALVLSLKPTVTVFGSGTSAGSGDVTPTALGAIQTWQCPTRLFPTWIPSSQSYTKWGGSHPRPRNFWCFPIPKFFQHTGTEMGTSGFSSSRDQPGEPQQVPHATLTLWTSVAGSLLQCLGPNEEIFEEILTSFSEN